MKTIVAPTDFSESSLHAVDWAARLACENGDKLVLLHICQLPITLAEAMTVYTMDKLTTEADVKMNVAKNKLSERYGSQLGISSELRFGNVITEIQRFCHSIDTRLLVMGTEKAGTLERFFLGGRTIEAIRTMDWPVVVVPSDAEFKGIKKIGLACDLHQVQRTIPLRLIEEFVKNFRSDLHVMHVSSLPGERFSDEAIQQTEVLRDMLEHLSPKYSFINHINVNESIDAFAIGHNIDLLIVLPKQHGFFHRLFYQSQSTRITLSSHVPIMAITEKCIRMNRIESFKHGSLDEKRY